MRNWGYFDASGTQTNPDNQGRYSPAVTVAGYLASKKQWIKFDKHWKAFLTHYQVPYLHMTDFIARQQVYKGWSEEKRIGFIKDAVSIIKSHVLYGIGMTLHLNDYKKVMSEYKHSDKILGTPYFFCTQRCLESGVDYARKINYNDSIEYVFESGDLKQHEVLKAYNEACEDNEIRKFYRLSKGSLNFVDGVENTPLQAADFLSHELYKEMRRVTYSDETKTYTRTSLVALFGIEGMYKYYVEEHLIGYIQDFIESIKDESE